MPANKRRPRREPCAGGPDWAAASERLIRRREPALRRARGVYATPRPFVLFVVRTAGALLESRFSLSLGLADRRVRLLDPCAGPMNFVLEAWREAIACGARYGLAAEWLLREHLLPHSRGIELLPGPHRLGRWAVRSFLAAHGIAAAGGSVPLALADALDEAAHEEGEDGEPEAIPVILGNRRKRERGPGGEPDENVFPGVAQGIAVLFLVKRPGLPKRAWHAELYGSRPAKLQALAELCREIDDDRAALQVPEARER
jgi:hypothetical protein